MKYMGSSEGTKQRNYLAVYCSNSSFARS